MKLNAQDLKKIVNHTLEHYNQRAEEFFGSTRDHDVSQNIAAMLQYIEGEPRFTILDFGNRLRAGFHGGYRSPGRAALPAHCRARPA